MNAIQQESKNSDGGKYIQGKSNEVAALDSGDQLWAYDARELSKETKLAPRKFMLQKTAHVDVRNIHSSINQLV